MSNTGLTTEVVGAPSGQVTITSATTVPFTETSTWPNGYVTLPPVSTWPTNGNAPVQSAWTTTYATLSTPLEVMVDMVDGFGLLMIDFTDSERTKQHLERLLRENYKHKDEIGERVRLGLANAGSAALTLPWLFAYLFSKREEHKDCAAYVEETCNLRFVKNGVLSLTGSSGSVWDLFACYEGTLAKISLEFAAFCQAL